MKKTEIAVVSTYAVYACFNSLCEEGEFAGRVPHISVDLPTCPCCGCPSLLLEILHRESER